MSTNITVLPFYFDVAFDLSECSDLDLIFTKPSGAEHAVTPTLGTSDVTVSGRNLKANEYVSYIFDIGEIDEGGDWLVYLSYDEAERAPRAARYLISPLETMIVEAVVI